MSNLSLQEKLSLAFAKSACGAKHFAADVRNLAKLLMRGDFSAGRKLKERVFLALNAEGGVVCAPLCFMAYVNPRPRDEGDLYDIRTGISLVAETVEEMLVFCGVPRRFLHCYTIRHDQLFTLNYFDLHSPRFLVGNIERLAEFRARAIAAVCETVRAFLRWFYGLIDRAMAIVRSRPEATEVKGRLCVALALRTVVALADPSLGLVILYGEDGGPAVSFQIPQESHRVWQIIRLLVEGCDTNGDVELPKGYGSLFRRRDAQGNALDDDIARFYRHIWPSPERHGAYRLMLREKPRLERGL